MGKGKEVGPWTDLYSVGCMAYELFTGKPPFYDADEPLAILLRHITEPLPPAAEVAGVDPDISAWIERLTAKERAGRPESATAAWEELEEILIGKLGPRWRREARLGDPPRPLPGPATPPPVGADGRRPRGSTCRAPVRTPRRADADRGRAGHRRLRVRDLPHAPVRPRAGGGGPAGEAGPVRRPAEPSPRSRPSPDPAPSPEPTPPPAPAPSPEPLTPPTPLRPRTPEPPPAPLPPAAETVHSPPVAEPEPNVAGPARIGAVALLAGLLIPLFAQSSPTGGTCSRSCPRSRLVGVAGLVWVAASGEPVRGDRRRRARRVRCAGARRGDRAAQVHERTPRRDRAAARRRRPARGGRDPRRGRPLPALRPARPRRGRRRPRAAGARARRASGSRSSR